MLKRLFLALLYLSYGIVLTLVLLVVRFPKDTALSAVNSEIQKRLPGFSCSIANAAYRYPFSVDFQDVRLVRESERIDLKLDTVSVTANPDWPLRKFAISANVFDGRAQADLKLSPNSDMFELTDISLSGIPLQNISSLAQRLDREVTGLCSFTGDYVGARDDIVQGNISGTVRVNDFEMELKRPILNNSTLEFDEISVLLKSGDGLVELQDGKATGPQYEGSFSGSIRLQPQLQWSMLDIGGGLSPRQEYIRKNQQVARAAALLYRKYKTTMIPYNIDGSIMQPSFRFGNAGEQSMPLK